MSYITSVERIGIRKGIPQGEILILKRQLQRRLSTRQKPQEPAELRQFILDIQHDMTDEIEAMAEEGLEGATEGFLKGIGC